MTGRDLIAPQADCHPIKRSKLQTRVARDTRYWRFTGKVTLDERLNYIAFEVFLEIENVERKTEGFGNTTCVVNVVERATTRRQWIAVFIDVDVAALVPKLHRKAHELMSLVL